MKQNRAVRSMKRVAAKVELDVGDRLAWLGVSWTVGYIMGHIAVTHCWFTMPVI